MVRGPGRAWLVSSDPVDLADDGAEPLWFGTYGGPARADGGRRRRVQLLRGDAAITLSAEEWERLLGEELD